LLKTLRYLKSADQVLYDLVTVGHFALDWIVRKNLKSRWTLGGPPTYVSLSAKALGANVSAISKVGSDFSDEYITWLSRNGIDLRGVKRTNGPTTRFRIVYDDTTETLQLIARCEPIGLEDLEREVKTKAIHIAPIADEISSRAALTLCRHGKLISLDPQGFLRRFDPNGYVHQKRWLDKTLLKEIDILKASSRELSLATRTKDLRKGLSKARRLGPRICIATMGADGVLLLSEDASFYKVPAYTPPHVVDPTGAGDAFAGAFLVEYLESGDSVWSTAFASAAASFVVEGVGPSNFGARHQTEERAEKIMEKVKKV